MKFLINLLFLLSLISLSACDNSESVNTNTVTTVQAVETEDTVIEPKAAIIKPIAKPKVDLENKRYLFNVTDHSLEELEALLVRTEEVSKSHPADFDDLEIIMVLHGPDVDWFKKDNHEHNEKLIELAERLDKYDVIDMKVCETTLSNRGVDKEDLPEFIESIPYAPSEIQVRLEQGYISL